MPKRILEEFRRRAVEDIAAHVPVVETPSTKAISSFLAYERRARRGGVGVGGTTLQHIQQYAESHAHGKNKCFKKLRML